jgi:hypothetical protein
MDYFICSERSLLFSCTEEVSLVLIGFGRYGNLSLDPSTFQPAACVRKETGRQRENSRISYTAWFCDEQCFNPRLHSVSFVSTLLSGWCLRIKCISKPDRLMFFWVVAGRLLVGCFPTFRMNILPSSLGLCMIFFSSRCGFYNFLPSFIMLAWYNGCNLLRLAAALICWHLLSRFWEHICFGSGNVGAGGGGRCATVRSHVQSVLQLVLLGI